MSSPAKATGNPLKSTMKKSKGNAKSKTKTTSHKSKVKVKPRRMSAMTLVEQAEMDIALSRAARREMEVRDLFAKLDKDGSGYIDRSELKSFLLQAGFNEEACTHGGFERFLEEEFKRADTSKDDQISFEEFVLLNNRLVDIKRDIQHLNYAISLVDHTSKNSTYLEQVERLARANKTVQDFTIDVVAQLDNLGDEPSAEVLQVFTCILILFGLPERETPKADWEFAKKMFDSPNFLEDLKTFDHTKLRRQQVQKCLKRSQPLVLEIRALEKNRPLAYSLLCWVLITIARATKAGYLDQEHQEKHTPIHRRSSFSFSLGTNARKGVFRLLDSDFFEGDFHKKKDHNNPGITLQVGRLEDTKKEAVNAIYFDRKKFTEEQAHKWWSAHKTDATFTTAIEKMESPRVDVSSFDFSSNVTLSSSANKKKELVRGPNTIEQWGYNDEGEFVMTIVTNDDGCKNNEGIVNGVDESVILPIRECLEKLKQEDFDSLAQMDDDPGHGVPSICTVAVLLGMKKLPENWLESREWCKESGKLNAMKSLDVRVRLPPSL